MESYKLGPNAAKKLGRLLGGMDGGNRHSPSSRFSPNDSSFSRVRLAQAPSGGIPARVGATPGAAVCTQVIVAPLAGSGFSVGDLVKTAKTFTVINWDTVAHGEDGDRIIQVSSHSDNAQLIGSSCVNEGTPSNIVLYVPTE